MIIKGGP